MYRLVRLLLSSAILVICVYFAVTVPIGKYTLWGHLVRIAGSPEAKDLADGAKETARDAARRAQRELDAARDTPRPARDPGER